MFAPILEIAPPGPHRAARALAIFDRQLAFQRKIAFHPEIGPRLQDVVDKMPPRQSTLIRATELYGRDDIAWTKIPPNIRQIAVAGSPDDGDYRYRLAPSFDSPGGSGDFAGIFSLRPAAGSSATNLSSVIAELGGKLAIDSYGLDGLTDSAAANAREVYGDLKSPWDTEPGKFNHHDQAALARFRRDFPKLSERIDHYFVFDNIVDEFSTPHGPAVLFNLDARVRPGSLKPFPHLDEFYRQIAPQITASGTAYDTKGNRWIQASFDRGRIKVTFMVLAGMIAPFDSQLKPAGEPIDLSTLTSGTYRTVSSAHVHRLGMDFGLDNLSFATAYRRDGSKVRFQSRMDSAPHVIAPPIVRQVALMIAGDFMRHLADGNGGRGLVATLSSTRLPDGMVRFEGAVTGEFIHSPTLEFLARIGDSIAEEHNEQVRIEERRLGEELFDAFVADYDKARPKILALDGDRSR